MFNQTVMLNGKTENNPLLPSFDSASINKNEKAMMSKTSAIGKLTKNINNPENTKQSAKTLKSRNNSSGSKLMKTSSVDSSAKRERVQSLKTIKGSTNGLSKNIKSSTTIEPMQSSQDINFRSNRSSVIKPNKGKQDVQ